MFSFRSGTVYEGDFSYNKKQGFGTFRFFTGSVFEGYFSDDKLKKGTLNKANGDVLI